MKTLPTELGQQFRNDGNTLLAGGDLCGAEACYRRAIATDSRDALALVNLGFALLQQNRDGEAMIELSSALALDARNADTHYLIGGLREKLADYAGAALHYQRAFELKPEFELACRDACRVLVFSGSISDARELIAAGLNMNPEFADFHFYQGNLYLAESALDEALACYERALVLGADYAALHGFVGGLLLRRREIARARTHLERAVELDPHHSDAHHDLGVVLQRLGLMRLAAEHQRIAITLDPGNLHAHSCLLFALSFSAGCTPQQYLTQARQFGKQASKTSSALPLARAPEPPLHTVRSLRVGFVSGDFRWHAVALFLEGVLDHLARQPLELLAFANNPNNDDVTSRLRDKVSQWHDIAELTDRAAAMLIRQCDVDVLIDLSGHTAYNRLPVFAWRPAPVQVSWLGYFASTGLAEMDYFLTDPFSTPIEWRGDFSERVWYLPETRLCMTPPVCPTDFPVGPLPGERVGYITFGSFQTLAKINDEVLCTWGQVMAAVPGSRLRLQSRYLELPDVRADLTLRMVKAGISPSRVDLHAGGPTKMYLQAHNEVDMILDTFPYPGGTTTAEALWMGVPTVSICGHSLLARQGASMLHNAGLPDWIADSEADYVRRAVRLAGDTATLANLRSRLRRQVLTSPLFDCDRFAGHLATALLAMHEARSRRIEMPLTED